MGMKRERNLSHPWVGGEPTTPLQKKMGLFFQRRVDELTFGWTRGSTRLKKNTVGFTEKVGRTRINFGRRTKKKASTSAGNGKDIGSVKKFRS